MKIGTEGSFRERVSLQNADTWHNDAAGQAEAQISGMNKAKGKLKLYASPELTEFGSVAAVTGSGMGSLYYDIDDCAPMSSSSQPWTQDGWPDDFLACFGIDNMM